MLISRRSGRSTGSWNGLATPIHSSSGAARAPGHQRRRCRVGRATAASALGLALAIAGVGAQPALASGANQVQTTTVDTADGSPARGVLTVAAGYSHNCAIGVDRTLWCWGLNWAGQLGDGTTQARTTPTRVGSDSDWSSIAAGSNHACGLRNNGTIWCWGRNSFGQLGDGTKVNRFRPVQTGDRTDWTAVMARAEHTCAKRADSSLWCWGYNANGQLGNGTLDDQPTPIRIGDETATWPAAATGAVDTCAITPAEHSGAGARTAQASSASSERRYPKPTTPSSPSRRRYRSVTVPTGHPWPPEASSSVRCAPTRACGVWATTSTASSATAPRGDA